ncbi:hypothetical protein DMENIID0001_017980 [Sergentomyia squamirostris]
MSNQTSPSTELSPFSKLKQSPARNLIPPPRRHSVPPPDDSPIVRRPQTRSRSGVIAKKPQRLVTESAEKVTRPKASHQDEKKRRGISKRRESCPPLENNSTSKAPPPKATSSQGEKKKFVIPKRRESCPLVERQSEVSCCPEGDCQGDKRKKVIPKRRESYPLPNKKPPQLKSHFRRSEGQQQQLSFDNNSPSAFSFSQPEVFTSKDFTFEPSDNSRKRHSTPGVANNPLQSFSFNLNKTYPEASSTPGQNPSKSFTFTLDDIPEKSLPKFHVPVVPVSSIFGPKEPPQPAPELSFNFSSVFDQSLPAPSFLEPLAFGKKQTDQEILNDFLKNHGYDPKKPVEVTRPQPPQHTTGWTMEVDEVETKMTIDSAQDILTQCDKIIKKMSILRGIMEENVDLISDYEWEIKRQKLEILRGEILETLHPLTQAVAIEELQQKLKKKQINRTCVHEVNSEHRSGQQMNQKRREDRKNFVEEWNTKVEQLEKEKKNKELEKKSSLHLLEFVKKRIKETKEFLAKFYHLQELNLSRTLADEINTEEAEIFDKKMDELKTIWEELLVEYEEEKINLEITTDHRITNEPLPPAPKSIESQWLETIFGPASIYDTKNPYLIAERDLNNFIQIRTLWDRYLVPEETSEDVGSHLPVFWALPSQNPTSQWEKYLRPNIPH